MEQNNQQVTQKLTLPIKTKIAVWWIVVITLSSTFFFLNSIIHNNEDVKILFRQDMLRLDWVPLIPFLFLYILFSCLMILSRAKQGWYGIVIMLFPLSLFWSIILFRVQFKNDLFPFIIWIFFVTPTILLILDRKNFWKIAK